MVSSYFHITARTKDQKTFSSPMESIWRALNEKLSLAQKDYGLIIHSFVLMRNHFHLICSTASGKPELIVDKLLDFRIKSKYVFNLPCFSTSINNKRYYAHAYRYVYLNPVRAGLCKKVEHYPYTSIGKKDLPYNLASWLPIQLGGETAELQWLNQNYKEDEYQVIKQALREKEFKLRACNMTRSITRSLFKSDFYK